MLMGKLGDSLLSGCGEVFCGEFVSPGTVGWGCSVGGSSDVGVGCSVFCKLFRGLMVERSRNGRMISFDEAGQVSIVLVRMGMCLLQIEHVYLCILFQIHDQGNDSLSCWLRSLGIHTNGISAQACWLCELATVDDSVVWVDAEEDLEGGLVIKG